ncbi:MAG: hypothetical protein J7L11_07805 [Thermoprotei archaeon]|nr:hypothetical protein [Thermoprotei archaeon]
MGDVLRVLYLFKSLWLPEVISELSSFRTTLGEEMPKADDVREAVIRLAELKLVTMKEGVKASLANGGIRSFLVTLNLSARQANLLALDERIRTYQQLRMKLFGLS